MNSTILANVWRFIILVLLQVLILKAVVFNTGIWAYLQVIIYPLFIILLPLRTPPTLVVFLGFVCGMLVDLFYSSIGIHAAATVFIAYFRAYILAILEPRGGYNVNFSPTAKRFGFPWFLRYAAIMLGFHLFVYFSIKAFTFYYILQIILNTLFTFLVSFLFILFYQFIFDPQE